MLYGFWRTTRQPGIWSGDLKTRLFQEPTRGGWANEKKCTEAKLQWGNPQLSLWSEGLQLESFCPRTVCLLKPTSHPWEGASMSLRRLYRLCCLQDPQQHMSFFTGGPTTGHSRFKHPKCKCHLMVPSESRWDYKTMHHILINTSNVILPDW